MLSIVIPIHNEEQAILRLYDRLTTMLEKLDRTYEIIFVDDASTDQGFDLLANLVETDNHLKVLRLRKRFGSTAALAAGFDEAKGETLVSLDSQHSPEDIPLLLKKLEEGYDIASACRSDEAQAAGTSKFAVRLSNWAMTRISGVHMHDFGLTPKAYRAEILKDVNLPGELHRFVPLLVRFYGAHVAEVPIPDRETPSHATPGPQRTFGTLFDVLASKFLLSYLARPIHAVGRWGAAAFALGSILLITLLTKHLAAAQNPLLLFAGAILCFGGAMVFSAGFMGEILMRTYFESQGRRIYKVRAIRARRERVTDGAR